MMTALRALVRKDIRLFFGDRRAVMMGFIAPIAIASFIGYIFGGQTETSQISVLFVDQDASSISTGILANLKASKSLDVQTAARDAAQEAVRKGKAGVAVVIPKDFGAQAGHAFFRPGDRPEITVLYDPSHVAEQGLVQGVLTGSVMQVVGRGFLGGIAGTGTQTGITMPYKVREEAVAGRTGARYNGYAHSFGGMSVQFILMTGVEVGIGMLLLRQRGLWKRLRAAPLSRGLLLSSRAISSAITSMLILFVVFGFARVVLNVRIEGSLAGFIGICVAFSLMTASFGLLIAAVGKTPEATRGLAILVTLLMVMLGGAWFPAFLFPPWLQTATMFIPTRWAMDGIDAMTWRGLGFSAALRPIGLLLLSTAIFGTLAITRFRWESEG